MKKTLEQILTPVREKEGIRYYDAVDLISLSAALTDYGRDYDIQGPDNPYEPGAPVKLTLAMEALLFGDWTAPPEIGERLLQLQDQLPLFALIVAQKSKGFNYVDIEEDKSFDWSKGSRELPALYGGRFAATNFRTMSKLYLEAITTPNFIGEIGGKLNGLDLRYFNSDFREFQDRYTGRDQSFYLHYFIAPEGELVVWKTGIPSNFQREGLYTLVGGSVKNHDSYTKELPKTTMTRAKFFDHQTGTKYVDRPAASPRESTDG